MSVSEENSAATSPSITYELTRRDLFVGFMTFIFRNRIIQVFILAVFVVSEIAVVLMNLGDGIPRTIFLCLFYAVLWLLALWVGLAAIGVAMAYLPKERGLVGEHTLALTEQGLVERTDFNESLHKWASICRVVSQFGYLYVYVNYSSYHQVPRRRVPSHELAAFERELRARVANAR